MFSHQDTMYQLVFSFIYCLVKLKQDVYIFQISLISWIYNESQSKGNIAIFHQLTERYQTGGLPLAEEPQVIVVMY